MKLHALTIALALAAGSALAAAPNTGEKADAAATSSTAAATTPTGGAAPVKKSHKKTSKKKHAATHVGMSHHGTHAMGAGPMSPTTDLQASSRQSRIDEAYAHWQAKAR
jgi:hypothetical protein